MKLHYFVWKVPYCNSCLQTNYFYDPNKQQVFSEQGIEKEDTKFIDELHDLALRKKEKAEYLKGLEYIGEIDVPEEKIVGITSTWNQYNDLKSREEKMRGYFNLAVKSLADLIK